MYCKRRFSVHAICSCFLFLLLGCSNETQKDSSYSFAGGFEIRWFYQGQVDTKVSDWFEDESRFGEHIETGERTDLYLLSEGVDLTSPKFRGGKARLELKYRTAQEDFSACDNSISGHIESWSKWKWNYSKELEKEIPAAFLETSKGAPRVEVHKKRMQRKFDIAADYSIRSVDMKDRLETGCVLEITELKVNDEAWWTLAFDVFTADGKAVEMFESVVCKILEDYPLPMPQIADSHSYPAWLGEVVSEGRAEEGD